MNGRGVATISSSAGGSVAFHVVGIGRGGQIEPLSGRTSLTARARRVVVTHGGVSQWYQGGPLGVEQGFTLGRRPAGASAEVTLALGLAGSLPAHRTTSGVTFGSEAGPGSLGYGDLSVVDSAGRTLPSRLALAGHRLLIRILDRGARYPLRVDPLLAQEDSPGGACSGPPPAPGDNCLPLTPVLLYKTTVNASGCGAALFMQVPLQKDAVEYDAVWTNSNPGATPWSFHATGGPNGSGSGPAVGEETWSTKALTPKNTGVNVNYTVPHGSGAWFVAAGGGPGPCSLHPGTAYGWAWVAHPVVSGTVTIQGTGGSLPAPDVVMKAACPGGGGTTKTDLDGDYGFQVHPYTTCTISPVLDTGEDSTPAKRVVHIADRDVKDVNFEVPCDAVPTTEFGTRRLATATSTVVPKGVGPCDLTVTITDVEQNNKAGLTRQSHQRLYGGLTSVAGFQQFGANDEVGSCLSGCTDLIVTVTDYKGQAVPNADVTIAVKTAILAKNPTNDSTIIPPYPNTAGDWDFFCDAAKPTKCADAPNWLKTDQNGQVKVTFWGPGVVQQATETLIATATSNTSGGCGCTSRKGHGYGDVTIMPHLIYQSNPAPLPSDTAEALAGWFDEHTTTTGQKLSKAVDFVVKKALKKYEKSELFEQAIQATVGTVAGDLGNATLKTTEKLEVPTEIALKFYEANEERLERNGWVATFMNLLNLRPEGLGDPGVGDVLTTPFTDALVKSFMDPGGLLDQYATVISRQLEEGPLSPQTLTLSIYDVSLCNKGSECGPGYITIGGEKLPGIAPYLYVVLTSTGLPVAKGDYGPGAALTGGVAGTIVIPYRAPVWDTLQPGLSG